MNANCEDPASKAGDGHIPSVADPIVVGEMTYAHVSGIKYRYINLSYGSHLKQWVRLGGVNSVSTSYSGWDRDKLRARHRFGDRFCFRNMNQSPEV